jgi:hypothetical protein
VIKKLDSVSILKNISKNKFLLIRIVFIYGMKLYGKDALQEFIRERYFIPFEYWFVMKMFP